MEKMILEEKNLKTPKPTKPVLAGYTEFRKYLQDFYNYKRATDRNGLRRYSYGIFSAAADIKSPNYLKLIIDGQRNLSSETIDKFSKALQLNKGGAIEFRALVEYGQAKDPIERNQALKRLSEFRVRRQLKEGEINEQTWDKVSSWVTWVLYNMADQKGVEFSPRELHKLLRGRATLDMIQKSKENLLKSGELVQNKDTGEIKKGCLLMEDSENVSVEMVRKLQSELIYLSLESLFQDEATDREFGTVTLSLTKEEFEKMKFELRQLKKRFFKDMAINRESTKGDRVYQLNVQFFPVTERAEPEQRPPTWV